ncbi:MAG: hypothetical protein J5I59_01790 [Saprospiraceae bacterium]|nr:hypothetical protein [Saprospiraceae bacterium]
MSVKGFIIRLIFYTISAFIVHFSLIYLLNLEKYSGFSLLCILFFSALSILFYIGGDYASRSRNIYLFNHLIIGTMITKMVLCAGLVFLYYREMKPENIFFIIPFFAHYTIYTVLILDFMTRQAKRKISFRR